MSRPRSANSFLDVAVAQGKAQIEPDRVLDDLGGEAMAPVAEQEHANILPDPPIAPGPVSVTMPVKQLLLAPTRRDIAQKHLALRFMSPQAIVASRLHTGNQRCSMIKLLTALTVVVILGAMATAGMVKPKIFSTVGAAAALPTVTVSVDELQRQVDVRALPVTEIETLY
jgi:hypothetical protein